MFKGFSFFGSHKKDPRRTQSLERSGRSKPKRTPSVYVPDDYPGWFMTWKADQLSVQLVRTIEQVARLSPAEFVSRRPLAGFQEEVIDGRKKYKKATTRDWDTLRATKVYKGEVSMKKKYSESGQDEKIQYLRCLDQRRRVLFIPLTARGDFYTATTRESQPSLPPRRSQFSPLPLIPAADNPLQSPHTPSPAPISSASSPDSGVQMRKRPVEKPNFENLMNWQHKVDLHNERPHSGEFEHTFPRPDINHNHSNGATSVGRVSSGISTNDGGSIDEEDPYKRHFELVPPRASYYTGSQPPPNYTSSLDGFYLRSASSFNNANLHTRIPEQQHNGYSNGPVVFQAPHNQLRTRHSAGAPAPLVAPASLAAPTKLTAPVSLAAPAPVPSPAPQAAPVAPPVAPERRHRRASRQLEQKPGQQMNNKHEQNNQANKKHEPNIQPEKPAEKEIKKDVENRTDIEQKKAVRSRKELHEVEDDKGLNKRERFWRDFFKTPA